MGFLVPTTSVFQNDKITRIATLQLAMTEQKTPLTQSETFTT